MTQPCLYCAGQQFVPLHSGVRDRLGFVPGERSFVKCVACGSALLDPLPKAEELAAFYPPVYSFSLEFGQKSKLKRIVSSLEYHLFFRPQYLAQVSAVTRLCGRAGRGRKLLDVGCGRGLRLLEFRKLGFEVNGLDLQDDVVRYLNDELRISARVGDVAAVAGELPNSYDVLTAFFLIEHIPDVLGSLAAMYRTLKPGGWLAAAVPLRDCVQAQLFGSRWINVAEAPRHLSLPTQRGMTHACRSVGFDRVEIRPDSVLTCSGQLAMSAIPGGTITHVYGAGALGAWLRRLAGGACTLAAIPFCYAENHILNRISSGIVLAQKPE
jgi:SAM-dependent methyltransferase